MSTLATLWWLLFWTVLGLCLGSFLNAVIYRLPRNRSLRSPLWSACPTCRHRIAWYDNIPIISFVLLRGRCRHCGAAIATRYLVVEVATALIVLMILDAFFISHLRRGLSDSPFGLTDRLASDWPIFVAHVILFACLLPMSVIDLEHYWVDVRFTNLAAIGGFVLHTLWTPRHSKEWIRPLDTTAVASLLALVGLGIVWLVCVFKRGTDPGESGEAKGSDEREQSESSTADSSLYQTRLDPVYSPASPGRVVGWVAVLMLASMFVVLWIDEIGEAGFGQTIRILVPLTFFLGLIAWENATERRSDRQIVEAIYQERHGARRIVLSELGLLLPAVALAAVGWWIMSAGESVSGAPGRVLHYGISIPGLRHWSPLTGLATAASGYIIAGAVGWSVRIVFTLVFGKEAFGSGDIHLMAATGAVAGWPVVVLGFFLTCALAMLGWVAALPFKRTRALPLGPWLSLSFLTVVLFYDTIIRWPFVTRVIDTLHVLFFKNPNVAGFGAR